jgi:predicted RNA-binding Zn-ribbon protein involved in translation (DUF1610 family)
MKLRKYEKVTKKDWFLTVIVLLIFIVLLSLSSLLLSGFLYFWVLIVLVGIALLVIWHAKNFAYLCPKCGQVFEVSAWEDLFGPNGGSKKYVRCPECRRQAWAEILKIKE